MKQKGFSLLESLISLTFFLLVVLMSLEFFGSAQRLFFKLKAAEETVQMAVSGLDKIRWDLHRAGSGLHEPVRLGIVEAVCLTAGSLILRSREAGYSLPENLSPGQARIPLATTSALKKGQEVCLFNRRGGELRLIAAVEKRAIILSQPLALFYNKEDSTLFSLEKVSIFLDAPARTVRRKVNASPAQPLMENALQLSLAYEKEKNLARVEVRVSGDKERSYEISVFPKNIALAADR